MSQAAQIIDIEDIPKLSAEGYEFSFQNPEISRNVSFGKIDIVLRSYLGLKVFLSNNSVGQATRLQGIKSPTGEIQQCQVIRV